MRLGSQNITKFVGLSNAIPDSGDDKASELRGMVAGLVLSDPETPGPQGMSGWVQNY